MVGEGGRPGYFSYETEEKAKQVVRSLKRKFAKPTDMTVGKAIEEYEVYLRCEKKNKPTSCDTTVARLRSFFTDPDEAVSDLTTRSCADYYESLKRRKTRRKTGFAVDTHRNTHAEAKTFLKWCRKRGWLAANPLDGVDPVGRRRHGKLQLRIDEARKWLERAIRLATDGEAGAVAAMVSLLMGLRASEIVMRQVRDLDDGGRLLWIDVPLGRGGRADEGVKTDAARRALEVPDVLRPLLTALASEKASLAPLFGHHCRNWPRDWVQRICADVGVPTVTAQGMRGLHSTLALAAGASGHVVAASLGHESIKTTMQSYADREVVGAARKQDALRVLQGGAKAAS